MLRLLHKSSGFSLKRSKEHKASHKGLHFALKSCNTLTNLHDKCCLSTCFYPLCTRLLIWIWVLYRNKHIHIYSKWKRTLRHYILVWAVFQFLPPYVAFVKTTVKHVTKWKKWQAEDLELLSLAQRKQWLSLAGSFFSFLIKTNSSFWKGWSPFKMLIVAMHLTDFSLTCRIIFRSLCGF